MGWKPEVQTVNETKWHQNGLTFATEQEAVQSAFDLMMRWSAVEDYRAVEVEGPATHTYVNGTLGHVAKEGTS